MRLNLALNRSSYSRLLGSLLIPGALRTTSNLPHLSLIVQGVDGIYI